MAVIEPVTHNRRHSYSTALAEGETGDALPLITRARHREHLERSLLHIEAFLSLGMVVLYLLLNIASDTSPL